VTVSRVERMFFDFAGHVSPSVSHQSQVWKLPAELNPVAVSGLVLTQVGVNMGMRPTLQPGDPAVVIGDGMVGHWAAQTLQHRGARVLMLGKHDDRLSRFRSGEHDKTVNITRENALDAIRRWTSDRIQVLADSVGSIETVESLFPVMRRFSHLVSAGFHGHDGRIDIQKMRDFEMTLHAPAGWTADRMDLTLDLLRAGKLKTLPLITHRFPVERAAEAFDLILSRREPVLGVILDWEEADQ
jgi:bacteriochlorophyllide a dehydrogenase